MRSFLALALVVCIVPNVYGAGLLDLTTALQNTYTACVGIDDDLYDMKVKAGVNTAVTSVGTGVGIGATVTGFVKQKVDKKIEALEEELKRYIVDNNGLGFVPKDKQENEQLLSNFSKYLRDTKNQQSETQTEIKKLETKSKKLGNWRTGLLAANTATNIAGAAIAGTNRVNDDLQGKIDACIEAVKSLNNSIIAAKINNEDVSEAQSIYEACREYEFIDVSPINKRATGAMISSAVGAGTGLAGTITSALANSDKIRDDNTDAGKKKEKDLNTASNVLSIGATAASATATVFNATQIAAIKKVAKVSEACTGVLK